MSLNVSAARQQARALGNNADEVKAISNQLESFQYNLNSHWQAEEMTYVNRAFNRIQQELSSIAVTLNQLETSIIDAAEAIRREEELEEKRKQEEEERKQEELEAKMKLSGGMR
ncbi:hypothetical protein [Bacillus sp. EB01]|uniref:hypothetical protein n=1 Tax=Bacillus sp. EB01 TaxID=1347086 RepID=UPI0005C69F3B|nr:hypothetical protein [Bacillus sp. EB01]